MLKDAFLSEGFIAGLVRHALTAGSGILVTDGLITGNQQQQAIGAAMVLFSVGWFAVTKWMSKK